MEDIVMNYIEDDNLTEDEYYSEFYNSNPKVDPDQLLAENKDVQNGHSFNQLQNSIPSNEFSQNSDQGTGSATTNVEKTSGNEEILPPIDALSSIVILKVETVQDTSYDTLTFDTSHKQELHSKTLNDAPNEDTKKITFKCDFCLFMGTSRFALARHKEKCKPVESLIVTELSQKLQDKKYSKIVTFNCDVCDFFATSRFALARHKNNHQDKQVEDRKIIIFNCEICSFSASSRFALARHQDEHEVHLDIEEKCVPVETTNQIIPKMRVFKCRWCHFTSKFRFALKRHAISHKKADTFTCTRCYNLVLTQSKSEHFLKCKKKCEHFTCDNCPYKTVYKKMFVKHQNMCKKELSTLEVPATIQLQTTGTNESNHKCKYCSFETKSHLTLIKHLKSHKSGRPLVKYPKVLSNAKQHQTIGKNESNYRCKYCSFSTNVHRSFCLHVRSHKSGRPIFKCKHCSYKSTYSAVQRHNQTSSCFLKNNVEIDGRRSKEVLTCNQCTFKTSWKPAWHKHIISHRGQTGRRGETFKCHICTFRTHWKTTIENHIRAHEKNMQKTNGCIENGMTECERGPFNTELTDARETDAKETDAKETDTKETNEKSEISLLRSENTNNTTEDPSAPNVNTEYKCKYCSVTCTRLYSLKLHQEKHTKLKHPVYKCAKCDFTGFKVSVGKHMVMKHENDKTWSTCHLCSYRTIDKDLETHLRTHENQIIKTSPRGKLIKRKKICCDQCSYTTLSKQQLKHHHKMHIKNNKPLVQCTLCDYKSFRRQLTKHYKNVHNKAKFNNHAMYYCKICSFSSKFRASVHTHTRNQHTFRKCDLYECDYCEFYSTKYSLAIHVSKVHGLAKDSNCD